MILSFNRAYERLLSYTHIVYGMFCCVSSGGRVVRYVDLQPLAREVVFSHTDIIYGLFCV